MTIMTTTTTTAENGSNTHTLDDLSLRLHEEALEALKDEPELSVLLHRTVLAPGVVTFEDAVASTVCYRLLLHSPCEKSTAGMSMFCPHAMRSILLDALYNPENLEYGHTMSDAVRQDALCVLDRDPACETLLEVVLFTKGFAALVCHRAARQKWTTFQKKRRRSITALFLQSQASSVFAVDIHPAATMGAGILLDHGTGIVIGETAVVGDGCTLLHGVTLGGTGKDLGDRHPKIGNHVLIGAGASILGNIKVGNAAKIGAGSIVLRAIPAGATAVGAPAKIIGRALEADPASSMDDGLQQVGMLHKSTSSNTVATTSTTRSMSNSEDESSSEEGSSEETMRPPGCVCPFRDYSKMARHAPRGTVTILTLGKLLAPLGCSHEEIGSLFFAMDTRNVGYIHRKDFEEQARTQMALNIASLEPQQMDEILQGYFGKHPVVVSPTAIKT